MAGKLFGINDWASDEKEEQAREYRRLQQTYINKMLGELKSRIASGDETPSILGNIFRQGLLRDEEVLLASYTGSKFFILVFLKSYHLLTACQQLLLESTSVIPSLG